MKQVLSENPDFMAILEHPEMTKKNMFRPVVCAN